MRRIRTMLLLLLGLGAVSVRAEPHLYIAAEPSPLAHTEGGRVAGVGPDQMREMMGRAGIDYSFDLLPWKRGYAMASQRADTCILYTTRTPEREERFKWVGPFYEAQWVLMARADSPIKLTTLDDARPYTIGTYSGDARDQFRRVRGFMVEPAPNDMLNAPKLIRHRIDLWAASVRPGSNPLARHGWEKQIVPLLTFRRIPVDLACNPKISDALVTRMNNALESMRRDGTLRRLEAAHENDAVDIPVPPGG